MARRALFLALGVSASCDSVGKERLKRGAPKRDWSDAEAKRTFCRVCGIANPELAHVIGRARDKPKRPHMKTLWVNPDAVVPLCGPFPEGCHGAYDRHELDLLPYLTRQEQARAVLDAGGLELARRRLAPSLYREKRVA